MTKEAIDHVMYLRFLNPSPESYYNRKLIYQHKSVNVRKHTLHA